MSNSWAIDLWAERRTDERERERCCTSVSTSSASLLRGWEPWSQSRSVSELLIQFERNNEGRRLFPRLKKRVLRSSAPFNRKARMPSWRSLDQQLRRSFLVATRSKIATAGVSSLRSIA